MSVKDRLADSLFCLVTGTLYVFAAADSILSATVLEVTWQALLWRAALFTAAFLAVFFNRYSLLTATGVLLAGTAVATASLLLNDLKPAWFLALQDKSRELGQFILGLAPVQPEYHLLLGGGLAAVLAFLVVLNTRVYFGFFILSLTALCVFAAPVCNGWDTSPRARTLILLWFIIMLARGLNLLATRERPARGPAYALALIPVGALAFALAWVTPKPDVAIGEFSRPGEDGGTGSLIAELVPDRGGTYTEEGGRLGGPVSLGDREVMLVEADERLYLGGSIRDTYTGASWEASNDVQTELYADVDGRYDITAPPRELAAAQDYYMRYYGMFTGNVTITNLDGRVRTVYTPPFARSLTMRDGPSLRQNNFGSIRPEARLRKNIAYSQEYIAWNYQNSYLLNVMRYVAAATGPAGMADSELAPYLALPESLPERVRGLAAELTAGYDNQYDKLKAIEHYLSDYPYTLEPSRVPSGEDFADYFLFEGREGYCVYYATAMAVLGRCAGIPTRYVEGYVMPRDRNEDGSYTVTGQQAHAWVEAYFPGFGWVPFEATQPYAVLDGQPPPETVEEVETAPAPEEEQQPESQEPEEPQPDGGAEEPEKQPAPPVTEPSEEEVPPSVPDEEPQPQKGLPRAAALVLALLAAVAGGVLSARLLTRRYRSRVEKLEAMPNREAAAEWFARIVGAAGAAGFPIRANETALAYADRVGGALRFREAGIGELAEIYSRAVYSEHDITDGERRIMRACYHELLRELARERKYRPGYYLDRYVRMRF